MSERTATAPSTGPSTGPWARPFTEGARLVGLGAYRPSGVLTSAELGLRFGKAEQWVRERTGMVFRRLAGQHETVASMAEAAVLDALAASQVPPDQVDLLILASCSVAPAAEDPAATVVASCGLPNAAAMNLNAACSGFCYALALAADAVRAGSARYVVVAAAEKMTAWVDPLDLGTSIIFGDGAGAAVVGPAGAADIGPVAWGSDGSKSSLIHIDEATGHMVMEGQAVFRWATTAVHPVALAACAKAGVRPEDLSALVPHQANMRIVDSLAAKIGATRAVVARDGAEGGNTSAASIPLALHRLIRERAVRPGDLALLIGFGAGLSFAAQVIRVP